MVKILPFHWRAHGFESYLGKFCMPHGVAKKKRLNMCKDKENVDGDSEAVRSEKVRKNIFLKSFIIF